MCILGKQIVIVPGTVYRVKCYCMTSSFPSFSFASVSGRFLRPYGPGSDTSVERAVSGGGLWEGGGWLMAAPGVLEVLRLIKV